MVLFVLHILHGILLLKIVFIQNFTNLKSLNRYKTQLEIKKGN